MIVRPVQTPDDYDEAWNLYPGERKITIHDSYGLEGPSMDGSGEWAFLSGGDQGYETIKCPFGVPGNILYGICVSDRITFRINDVAVGRLKDMSEGDAEACGFDWGLLEGAPEQQEKYIAFCKVPRPLFGFRMTWDYAYLSEGLGFGANPLCWFIGVEQVFGKTG